MKPVEQHRVVRASGLKYLPDYALVEQLIPEHGIRLFPHTEQLPVIYRAVHREFFEDLPNHLVKTDHRGDDARKVELYSAALMFCELKNSLREDGLAFMPCFRKDFVARVAIVQHVTRTTPKGKWHFFELYDEELLPQMHLNALPFAFSSHAMERYAQRVCGNDSFSLSSFLNIIFTSNGLFMRVRENEPALILEHPLNSLIALTFAPDIKGGYYFTTCLTAAQISHMEPDKQLLPALFHFGPGLPEKTRFNFNYADLPGRLLEIWKKKTMPVPFIEHRSAQDERRVSWHWLATQLRETERKSRLKPGQRLAFQGNMHSAYFGIIEPGNPPPLPIEEKTFTILEMLQKKKAEQAAAASPATPPADTPPPPADTPAQAAPPAVA